MPHRPRTSANRHTAKTGRASGRGRGTLLAGRTQPWKSALRPPQPKWSETEQWNQISGRPERFRAFVEDFRGRVKAGQSSFVHVDMEASGNPHREHQQRGDSASRRRVSSTAGGLRRRPDRRTSAEGQVRRSGRARESSPERLPRIRITRRRRPALALGHRALSRVSEKQRSREWWRAAGRLGETGPQPRSILLLLLVRPMAARPRGGGRTHSTTRGSG